MEMIIYLICIVTLRFKYKNIQGNQFHIHNPVKCRIHNPVFFSLFFKGGGVSLLTVMDQLQVYKTINRWLDD